ncbi:MAG: hypothetical protein JNM88_14615 [Chitinophagaceae bacterium]|nr:hypothetical protein [Chitinophagaceae bacterium]
MKYLLIFLFILPGFVKAQDCKLIKETDPYTRQIKISSGFVHVDGGSVSIDADNKEIIVLFSLDGQEKCFDENSTAEVFFEGLKGKTQSRNQGTMNCEGLFQFVFRNTKNTPTTMLQRMMTKKITHIIFTGNSKKPVTVNIGPKEQEAIMSLATCVVNEGKTLLQ